MQFTPIQEFFSDELRSHYLVGLSYTAKPEDEKLAALVEKWIEEGKIKPGAPGTALATKAKLAGSGIIGD